MEAPFLIKIVAHPTTDPSTLALRLTDEHGEDIILCVGNEGIGELVSTLCSISGHLPAIGPEVESGNSIPPALIAHHIGVDTGRFADEAALTIYVGGMRLQLLVSARDLSAGLKSLGQGNWEERPN